MVEKIKKIKTVAIYNADKTVSFTALVATLFPPHNTLFILFAGVRGGWTLLPTSKARPYERVGNILPLLNPPKINKQYFILMYYFIILYHFSLLMNVFNIFNAV